MKKTLFILLSLLIYLNTAFANTRGIRKVEFKTPSGETVGLYEESHALVIGVSDYTAGWPDLESVAKDVDAVSASLEGHGFNVEHVLNPTKKELANAFGDFIDKYGYDPENRLLFYYSGHGYTQELHGRQVGYLVPSDAPDPNEDQKGFFRRSLRMTQILSWSKQIQAKHALFIFDSCFSGSVLKERALVVPQQIRAVTDKPVRQFISAGSAGQTVPADSIFRPSFIRGIQGEADLDKDGYVTGTELGLFLQKRVTSYDTGQTPQFGKIKDPLYDEGDFVFALEKSVQKKGSTIGDANLEDERQKLDDERKKLDADRQKLAEQKEAEIEYQRQENKRKRLAAERKEADHRYERQQLAEEKRKVAAERRRIAAEQSRKKTATAPKTQTDIFSNSERMRVRFDSSLVGSHEANFLAVDETEKSLTLQTLSIIFKNNFGVGISKINLAGTTTSTVGNWDFKTWGVSGNFLNGYYVFEETNPNTYWIDEMPLSLTLGTSYPLSLEIKYWGGSKDNEANMGSQLISIGATVAADIELILNRSAYRFSGESGQVVFYLTTYSLGIGYLF